MKKFVFASRPKSTIKTPSYYNIQVSVNKDYTIDLNEIGFDKITLYANEPMVFVFNGYKEDWKNESTRLWNYGKFIIEKRRTHTGLYYGSIICQICEGIYPIPEIVSAPGTRYNDTTFTFTPIPVYE
jgi:hypothetical protein